MPCASTHIKAGFVAGVLVALSLRGDCFWAGVPLAALAGEAPDLFEFYQITGHRRITHGLLFWLFLGFVFPEPLSFYAWGGCASHLLLDFLTPAGIPLFWPLKNRFGVSVLAGKKKNKFF